MTITARVYPGIGKHIAAAARRARVRLPDGTEGTIVFVTRRSGRAKIRMGGRYRMIPVEDLTYMPGVVDEWATVPHAFTAAGQTGEA